MSFDVWLLYLGTILLFMCSPGPSHILMISVSMGNGFKRSIATAAGDLSANTVQILLAGLGLASIIMTSRYGFAMVKWLGVIYLIWIGLKTIILSFKNNSSTHANPEASLSILWFRGFVTSAANPKAVVFFAALFPQFIASNEPLAVQILILGSTYIVIDGIFLLTYGFGSDWLAQKLQNQYKVLIDRFSGASLIVAAILLGLRRSSDH